MDKHVKVGLIQSLGPGMPSYPRESGNGGFPDGNDNDTSNKAKKQAIMNKKNRRQKRLQEKKQQELENINEQLIYQQNQQIVIPHSNLKSKYITMQKQEQ